MSFRDEVKQLAPALLAGLFLRLALGLWARPFEGAQDQAWGPSLQIGMASVGDLATLWLLARIWLRLKPAPRRPGQTVVNRRAYWACLAWAALPLAAWVGASQGHNDSLVLALLLWAVWMLEFSDQPRSELWAAVLCGLACGAAPWALLTLPIYARALLSLRERLKFMALSLAVALPLALSLLFASVHQAEAKGFALGLGGALDAALKATGAGSDALLGAAQMSRYASWAVLGLLWVWMLFSSWRPPLLAGLSLVGMMLWVFAPHLELRQLLPALAFSLLLPGRWALRLGLASTLALSLALLLQAKELPAWGLALLAMVHFGFWFYACAETLALLRVCAHPKGKLDYQA